ncbi:endonuclease domain-containing protein [Thermodesulfovibrionales bacterium]|nr:endonuclease domain-containing protein [Thermodesulfovibrionales bacterium]
MEELFWRLVRNRQFLGLKFRRQHQVGDYILDFYCHEKQTAIEFDGIVHKNRKEKDAKRDAYLKSQGIKVIRIANQSLLNNPEQTLQNILAQFPSPFGRGVGGEGRFSAPLNRSGHVLMIDARSIYRKVTRKIFDFSPEQQQNILSIVWLYRGETKRFHDLVVNYISKSLDEAMKSIPLAGEYEKVFVSLNKEVEPFLAALLKGGKQTETVKELAKCLKAYKDNCKIFSDLAEEKKVWWKKQNKDKVKLCDAVKELELFAEENNKLINLKFPCNFFNKSA